MRRYDAKQLAIISRPVVPNLFSLSPTFNVTDPFTHNFADGRGQNRSIAPTKNSNLLSGKKCLCVDVIEYYCNLEHSG